MNRRSFFAALAGAPIAVAGVAAAKPTTELHSLSLTVDTSAVRSCMAALAEEMQRLASVQSAIIRLAEPARMAAALRTVEARQS